MDSQRRRVAWGLCRKTTSQWSEALRERSFHFSSVLLNIVKPRYKLSTSGTCSTVPFEECCKTTSQWSLAIKFVRSVLLVKLFNIYENFLNHVFNIFVIKIFLVSYLILANYGLKYHLNSRQTHRNSVVRRLWGGGALKSNK